MLTINSNDIVNYTKCPRRFNLYSNLILSGEKKPDDDFLKEKVVSKSIKALHTYKYLNNKDMTWEQLRKKTEIIFLELIDGMNYRIFNEFTKYKGILNKVLNYYSKHYCTTMCFKGIPDVSIRLALDNNLVYDDDIDLVFAVDVDDIRLVDFKRVYSLEQIKRYSQNVLEHDLDIFIKTYFFWKNTNIKPTEYIRIILAKTGMKIFKLKIDNDKILSYENDIKYILTGIKNKNYYPSRSEQCNYCFFTDKCGIFIPKPWK